MGLANEIGNTSRLVAFFKINSQYYYGKDEESKLFGFL